MKTPDQIGLDIAEDAFGIDPEADQKTVFLARKIGAAIARERVNSSRLLAALQNLVRETSEGQAPCGARFIVEAHAAIAAATDRQ